MKKLFALTLAFVILLTACQPVVTGTPAATRTAAASPTASATLAPTLTPVPDITLDTLKLKQLQIHIIHPWTGDTGKMMTQLVDQFNQTNQWGIFVIEIAPGSAGLVQDKYRELMLNNVAPDVLAVSPSQLLRDDQLNANILDLNPYVESAKFGLFADEQKDFLPAFWIESVFDGKRYGIPAQRTSEMLFYNITWAKELGFTTPPATFAEFRTQVCAANASKRKDNDASDDGLGGWIINNNALTTLSWLRTFEIDPFSGNQDKFSSDPSDKALGELLKMENDTCAWLSRLPQPYDYFANRQSLVYSGSMQDLLFQTRTNARLESKDEWTVLTYPHEGKDSFLLTEGTDYGITKSTAERQLAAWLFVRWLSAPEQQAWLLRKSGTLPLGEKVQPMVTDFSQDYPLWQKAVDLMAFAQPLPNSPSLDIAKMVLEDGGWQLYKTGLKSEAIPALLDQVDAIITELAARTE